MEEKTNWGPVLADIVILIIASQTAWCLLILIFLTGSYKLNKKKGE